MAASLRLRDAAGDLLDALKNHVAAYPIPSTACKERTVYENAIAAIAKAAAP
jgi:hypothetical protein